MSDDPPTATELAAALRALMTHPHIDLGDLVYDVREREGRGWDGPAVIAWSAAVTNARNLMKRMK